MVNFIEKNGTYEMVITVENVDADYLEYFQNALTTALVELNSIEDVRYESESYYLGQLLKSMIPSVKLMKQVFNTSLNKEFLDYYFLLSDKQKNEIKLNTLLLASKNQEIQAKQHEKLLHQNNQMSN